MSLLVIDLLLQSAWNYTVIEISEDARWIVEGPSMEKGKVNTNK